MAKPLTPDDFPLYAAGPHVYRRTESSPLFTAPDMQMAGDIAFRLNAHEMGKWTVNAYGWQPDTAGVLTSKPDPARDGAQPLPLFLQPLK